MRVSTRHSLRLAGIALAISVAAFLLLPHPVLAHAMPLSESPAPNANLLSPPASVRILFSERLNAAASKILVVNNADQEVDQHDSHVLSDGVTMITTLNKLSPGTYVVFWRSTSADDGHIMGMSYVFHVERPDGTVPALTGPLPGNNPLGGSGTALDISGVILTLAQAISLLALTLILGGIFWRWFVMPRQPEYAPQLPPPLARRFDRAWRIALWAMLGAIVVQVLAQVVELSGSLVGIFAPELYGDILLQSQFGFFTILQLVLAVDGLVWLHSPEFRRSYSRYAEIAFGVALAITFVYGGHAGATTLVWAPLVDLVHVFAEGVWVGGLFTLALVVLPDLAEQDPECNVTSQYLAKSVPAFSVPALASVGLLIVTGPLNATVRMTAFSQLWTTAYGIDLLIKIGLFLTMALISYDHAFRLRPRLAEQLAMAALPGKRAKSSAGKSVVARQLSARRRAQDLARAIATRVRVEAGIGASVVVCAAFLAPLSVTLAPALAPSSAGQAMGVTIPVHMARASSDGSLFVTLNLDPGRSGANGVTVTVKGTRSDSGQITQVFILANIVGATQGAKEIDLHPSGASGTFGGQGDFPRSGQWNLTVEIRVQRATEVLIPVAFAAVPIKG